MLKPLEEEEDVCDGTESPLTETINLQKMRLNARRHFTIAAEKHVKPPHISSEDTSVDAPIVHHNYMQPIQINSDREIMKINSIFKGNKTIGESLTERGSHFEFSR